MRLYTDIDPFCCEVLSARVADGGLPPGEVWCRDIKTLTADELKPFTQVHLFAGIGGSPLGFKWAGWPDDWSLVTGGFPCQSVSVSGNRKGESDPRFLWPEMNRVVDAIRPDWVFVENSPALRTCGGDRVLGDLERIGYAAWPLVVGSEDLGASDKRDRAWIVAYSGAHRSEVGGLPAKTQSRKQWTHPVGHQRPVHRPWPPRPSHVSDIPRMADGLPGWMDKRSRNAAIDATGNAQNPRVVEVIARAMMEVGR